MVHNNVHGLDNGNRLHALRLLEVEFWVLDWGHAWGVRIWSSDVGEGWLSGLGLERVGWVGVVHGGRLEWEMGS